jgi:hypothetical protein
MEFLAALSLGLAALRQAKATLALMIQICITFLGITAV